MIQPIHFYLLGAFIVAMIIANIVLPNILLISHKKRLFDMPDKRKVHHAPIPRLGGLSFFPVMLITMGGLVLVHHLMGLNSGAMQGEAPYEYLALLVGSMMLFLVGLADDLIGVGYKKKFIVQPADGAVAPDEVLELSRTVQRCGVPVDVVVNVLFVGVGADEESVPAL